MKIKNNFNVDNELPVAATSCSRLIYILPKADIRRDR